jgi:hypothetical protein
MEMTANIQANSEIEQQFDDAQKLFDERIQSKKLMCRIFSAYAGPKQRDHNCLGCNFNELSQQISAFLEIVAKQDGLFTLQHACALYFLHLNTMWERISDVFNIISVPESYRVRHYQSFIRARRWANFFKHPKEFGWLVHHPKYTVDGTQHHRDLVESPCEFLFIDETFVKDFYACDRAKGLAKKLDGNETTVVVVFPNLLNLTSEVVDALANFVDVVTKNPVYFEILNDKATVTDFYARQCV